MYTCACSSDGILALLLLIVSILGLPVAFIVYCIMKTKGLDEEVGTYIQYIQKECLLLFGHISSLSLARKMAYKYVHVCLWLSVQRPTATLQCILFT